MGSASKDLPHLEQTSNKTVLEKSLYILENATDDPKKKKNAMSSSRKNSLRTTAVPESQVLGRLKGFLQVIDEANRKLNTNVNVFSQADFVIPYCTMKYHLVTLWSFWTLKRWHLMQYKPREDYDIEVLTGEEEHYIEMDLALGVADLHTPEALAAAKSTLAGQREICVPAVSDDSYSSYSTKATDDSDYEMKAYDVNDSSGNCDKKDGNNNCRFETEADRTLGWFQKSGIKRLACIGKGQKRPKIEMLT